MSGSLHTETTASGTGSEGFYSPLASPFDEAYFDAGSPRSHWRYLLDSFTQMGAEGIQERQNKARRILRDDGATYNQGRDRPGQKTWELDPIPMLLESSEWADIETGLIERSELFNLILQDIYGPRELIRQQIIPPEVLFSHPGFIRPCCNIPQPWAKSLTLHAVDMVRDPQGQICIIGDRTQAPSGAGYALENRTVLSRIIPSIFRDSQVHRLSLYFQQLKSTLSTQAPEQSATPNIVILTPGAYNETYFEHAYLSNYLGYPLVQGSDLTVKDGKVWLKSLSGLSKVDVILRRVDDYYCDPVELKADSFLGIPGLLEAVRAGNVVVSNPLGSGILESPVLLKYLPQISQFFLGRTLSLPSVATWWCADPQDMVYIRANLHRLIIKPVIRNCGSQSIYGHQLTAENRQQVLDKISQSPFSYVAQSYVTPSRLPVWQQQSLQPRPAIFRSFTVANPGSYTVMAGGLTRVGLSDQDMVVTNQMGSRSKDTWILASEPEKQVSLLKNVQDAYELGAERELPGRVVENLFWMGRYAERAESALRLIRSLFIQMNGVEPLSKQCRDLLLSTVTSDTDLCETSLVAPLLDANQPDSVKSSLLALLSSSEEVKEMLSTDTHRIINDLRDNLYELERAFISGVPSAPEEALDPLVTTLLALSGVCHESMTQGIGWCFLELGRRTERTLQTSRLIEQLLTAPLPGSEQQQVLETTLLSVETLITFKRRYRSHSQVVNALHLLLSDPGNPRSILYQLLKLQACFDQLPQKGPRRVGLSDANRLILKAINEIQLADPEVLSHTVANLQRTQLKQLTHNLTTGVEGFSNALSSLYFDHSAGPQQLSPMRRSGQEPR